MNRTKLFIKYLLISNNYKLFIATFSFLLPLAIGVSTGNSTSSSIHTCSLFASSGTIKVPGFALTDGNPQTFSAIQKDVDCSKSSVLFHRSELDHSNFSIYPTGDIVFPMVEYLMKDEYCISRLDDVSIEIKHCKVLCGVTHTCIHKCCPPNEVIDFSKMDTEGAGCSHSGETVWKPTFYDKHKRCGVKTQASIKYHFYPVPVLTVNSEYTPYKHIKTHNHERIEGLRFRLMSNGDLKSQNAFGGWEEIKFEDFCVDGTQGFHGSKKYSGKLEDQAYLVINDDNEYEFDDFEDKHDNMTSLSNGTDISSYLDTDSSENSHGQMIYIYISMLFIGSLFLLSTSIVYVSIWEKHNIHGWTIFAFVTVMLFMLIFLALSHLFSILMTDEFAGTATCKTTGILAHFFYLSTMCWLTVINIDLWLTFRNIKPLGGKTQTFTRFGVYSLFGFGIPLLIVGTGVVVDSIYEGSSAYGDGTECEPVVTLPLYGEQNCYVQSNARWQYLYIPMAILISCNILTFSWTVYALCTYRSKTQSVVGNNSSHHRESLILLGKLFAVTGISWVLELISNVFHELVWLWILFDAYNLILQPLLIFIIFVWKRENIIFFYHKYPSARCLVLPIMRAPCCYSASFDPEQTDMTGVSMDRSSRIHFRRGSNF